MTEEQKEQIREIQQQLIELRNVLPHTAEEYNRNRLKFDALSLKLDALKLELSIDQMILEGTTS